MLSSTQMEKCASANLCSISISNIAEEVAGKIVGEVARATFVEGGWVRPAGTGFGGFVTMGAGALATEGTAVAADTTGSAILTGAPPPGGSGPAALGSLRGPNEITQSPKMRSPINAKAPTRDFLRSFNSGFSAE